MKVEKKKWTESLGWQNINNSTLEETKAQLVLGFGDRFLLKDPSRFDELKHYYPGAHIVLASSAGNIQGVNIEDQSIVTAAIAFESGSYVEIQRTNIKDVVDSHSGGASLGNQLTKNGLKHVFLLSDGHLVNGSRLLAGILSTLPKEIAVTGGLAGDGARFEMTLAGVDAPPSEGEIIAIGFYGSKLKFGFGSFGGWDPFGLERKITKSSENILYELDGKSALDLYKKYLGDLAGSLPGSALLFPLAIRPNLHSEPFVRTILSINDDKGMVFAGNVPEGWYAQLMKANFDRLVDGAGTAATLSQNILGIQNPDLAILISCVGRRLVLDQRTEEELDAVMQILGEHTPFIGFYSYGEIAPLTRHLGCELHNQTMTITVMVESL